MDLARTLVRTVVRAFYETRHVLVIDALMVHSALLSEDLAHLLGMQQKDLRKLCGKLKEDRLLAVHSRQETREGQQRPINKDYYYIDFHATIDAIKYRMFQLDQKVKQMYKPSEEKKDYHCPICKAQWTQLEVLDSVGPMGFECHRCGGVLEREEPGSGASTGHETQSKLASQLDSLLKLLRQIDSKDIPNNDFDTAFSKAKPIPRDERFNPTQKTNVVGPAGGPPAAVKGITQITVAPLDVSVTTGTEKTAAEKAVEAQRKADIAAQNVLPVWHTTSTVMGESTVVGRKGNEHQVNGGSLAKEDEEEKKDSKILNDELTAYYAQLAQEKEQEAREDREADDSSEDEDEYDFEDVGIRASAISTPSSSISVNASGHALNGNARPKGSESGSSVVTKTSTPADSGAAAEDEDVPVAKKVKFENQEDVTSSTKAEVGEQVDKVSDEDEEAEFEDAL